MSIFDPLSYPWHLREAVDLHGKLCELYPTGKRVTWVAQKVGIGEQFFNADQPADLVWKEVLELAWPASKGRALVEVVRADKATSSVVRFFDDLLASKPTVIATDRPAKDGAPAFLAKSDTISEDEALLFHDDLTLSTGRLPWLIGVLTRLQTLAAGVFRMKVSFGGVSGSGTGFRIGDDLVLTNFHVVHFEGQPATRIVAELGYEEDAAGQGLATQTFECKLAASSKDDDWAIVRAAAALPATPIFKLSEATQPIANQPAFLIQHPGGERKRIGYVRNQVTDFDDRVIHYLTDTQPGSSGSPVLDDQGRLIGLHHQGGRPQEVAGQPPLKKNEGIRIPRILANLPAGLIVP